MWYDEMTTEIINLLSQDTQLKATITAPNWWDAMAIAIAEVLQQYAHTIPVANESRMTQALNDLQQLVTTAQTV